MDDALPGASGMLTAPAAISAAFRFRKGNKDDLPHCLALLPAGFRATGEVRQHLPSLWAALIAREAHIFAIIEDLERPFPERIEAFGMSTFVTDGFLSAFESAPRSQLAALVYERMLAGEDVLLNANELATANSTSGINAVVLHSGMCNEDLSDLRSAQAMNAGAAAFYFFHGGYRIQAIVNEVFGSQTARFMEAGGFRLVHDFQQESPAAFQGMAPNCYPYLFMLRREWIEFGAVNPLSQLFHSPSPRIGFSRAEQRVLEHALLNESDAAIASALGISRDAVKKTWRNIFARVSRHASYLLPPDPVVWSDNRGQEKRRHLIEYLRIHLEELRPINRQATTRQKSQPQNGRQLQDRKERC
jgi:DNA-binding CsgD family transcriptional regulator